MENLSGSLGFQSWSSYVNGFYCCLKCHWSMASWHCILDTGRRRSGFGLFITAVYSLKEEMDRFRIYGFQLRAKNQFGRVLKQHRALWSRLQCSCTWLLCQRGSKGVRSQENYSRGLKGFREKPCHLQQITVALLRNDSLLVIWSLVEDEHLTMGYQVTIQLELPSEPRCFLLIKWLRDNSTKENTAL